MICKQFLALFLWCHCYQILLNPLLQLIAIGLSSSTTSSNPFGGLYVVGTPITVAANKVNLTPGQEIVLHCNIAEFPDIQFEWYKKRVHRYVDSSPMDDTRELVKNDERYSINNNVMIIKSSTLEDVGDYFCRVKEQQEGIELEKMISVRPKPYILDFEIESSTTRSAVVEDGKLLKIACNVVDEYSPPDQIRLNWQMAKYDEGDMNEVNSGEDGIRLERVNDTRYDLIIDRVTKDHRRLYKCHASNGITENSKAILIRIKNKYSSAWPAVGIIIELVILIGVICFVENRKVEPDKGANDRKPTQM